MIDSEIILTTRVSLLRDKKAFEVLVLRHQSSLRRFLLYQCHYNQMMADDIAQETLIAAWLSIHSFENKSTFKSWLLRIAYFKYIDHIRAEKNQNDEDLETIHLPADQDQIEIEMDLQSALLLLPSSERTALILFYIEDQPIDKIAVIMKAPIGSIKSYLSRGRQHLSHLLKKDGYED